MADKMLKTDTITAQYLNGKMAIEVPALRREGNGKHITIHGATGNNLKGVDIDFPLGKLIVVTGVSGSGKSTLINGKHQQKIAQAIYNGIRKQVAANPSLLAG